MHEVVHEVLGSELTLAEAEKMVEEVDHQHAGKISLQEVRGWAVEVCFDRLVP
jgi:Ca2+-binding EF-hand superfamily protein